MTTTHDAPLHGLFYHFEAYDHAQRSIKAGLTAPDLREAEARLFRARANLVDALESKFISQGVAQGPAMTATLNGGVRVESSTPTELRLVEELREANKLISALGVKEAEAARTIDDLRKEDDRLSNEVRVQHELWQKAASHVQVLQKQVDEIMGTSGRSYLTKVEKERDELKEEAKTHEEAWKRAAEDCNLVIQKCVTKGIEPGTRYPAAASAQTCIDFFVEETKKAQAELRAEKEISVNLCKQLASIAERLQCDNRTSAILRAIIAGNEERHCLRQQQRVQELAIEQFFQEPQQGGFVSNTPHPVDTLITYAREWNKARLAAVKDLFAAWVIIQARHSLTEQAQTYGTDPNIRRAQELSEKKFATEFQRDVGRVSPG